MTPREQITEEKNKRFPVCHPFLDIGKESFRIGAEYGYNLAIEKVYEYLESIGFEQRYLDSESLFDKEQFIDDLKQAMKL